MSQNVIIKDPITGDDMVDVLANIAPELLNQKCLDHGFVKVLDCMPRLVPASPLVSGPYDKVSCDFAIADAARISYLKGTRKISADSGLIDNLIRNRHTSPIEMGELKFHIRLPIFAMRQHVRHRTASLNEESARYSELASDFYVPASGDWAMNTTKDKQATEKLKLDPRIAECLHQWVSTHGDDSYRLYQQLLEGSEDCDGDIEIPGIAREQARMVLGVNIYTQCVWKIDLKNLLHYLSLRTDKHAQYEIRVFADAIARVVAALFPACWASHKDSDPFMDGVNFGWTELEVLRNIMYRGDSHETTPELLKKLGWTPRRYGEFKAKANKAQFLSPGEFDKIEAYTWPKVK